ncbi:MAG: DoxX family protein [Gemmatimonadales bacterium]|nr:MAG: DoxX family protein [Gemmatimonadales bacterium]
MSWLSIPAVLQFIVGLGLLNVWLLRSQTATEYRGGSATSLKEEFRAYGLPDIAFYVVGALKILAGIVLIAGIWINLPVTIAAAVVAVLMVGALAMHVKVRDPIKKSVPAALMLVMSLAIVVLR